jgi:hypothetical protein
MLQDGARVLAAGQELEGVVHALRGGLLDEEAVGLLRGWLIGYAPPDNIPARAPSVTPAQEHRR